MKDRKRDIKIIAIIVMCFLFLSIFLFIYNPGNKLTGQMFSTMPVENSSDPAENQNDASNTQNRDSQSQNGINKPKKDDLKQKLKPEEQKTGDNDNYNGEEPSRASKNEKRLKEQQEPAEETRQSTHDETWINKNLIELSNKNAPVNEFDIEQKNKKINLDIDFGKSSKKRVSTSKKSSEAPKVKIFGIKNTESVKGKYAEVKQKRIGFGRITTDAIYFNKFDFDYAKIKLPKTGEANSIIKCTNFNPENSECSRWQDTNIEFEDNEGYIEFEVDSFSAYAAASVNVINVYSKPIVHDYWTVLFDTQGKSNLKIMPVNSTRLDKDLVFANLSCGKEKVSPVIRNGSVSLDDYDCSDESKVDFKVLTKGKHYLKFIFGEDTEYAFNNAWEAQKSFRLDLDKKLFDFEQVKLNENRDEVILNYSDHEDGFFNISLPKLSVIKNSSISITGLTIHNSLSLDEQTALLKLGNLSTQNSTELFASTEMTYVLAPQGSIINLSQTKTYDYYAGGKRAPIDIAIGTLDSQEKNAIGFAFGKFGNKKSEVYLYHVNKSADELCDPDYDKAYNCMQGEQNDRVWEFDLVQVNNMLKATSLDIENLTSEEGNEVVIGATKESGEDTIYAVGNNEQLIWSHDTGSEVTDLTVTDIDSDKVNEVIAASENKISVISGNGSVEWTYGSNPGSIIHVLDTGNLSGSLQHEIVFIEWTGTESHAVKLSSSGEHIKNVSLGNKRIKVMKIDDVFSYKNYAEIIYNDGKSMFALDNNLKKIWAKDMGGGADNLIGIETGEFFRDDEGKELLVSAYADMKIHVLNFNKFPRNLSLDLGNDGFEEWSRKGILMNKTILNDFQENISSVLQQELLNCNPDTTGQCVIKNKLKASDYLARVSGLNISYIFNATNTIFPEKVVHWPRKAGFEVGEKVISKAYNLSFAVAANDIKVNYIKVNASASYCSFNGTKYNVTSSFGQQYCNISGSDFVISSSEKTGDVIFYDDVTGLSVPISKNESFYKSGGYELKNVTLINQNAAGFKNITFYTNLSGDGKTGSFFAVDWNDNSKFDAEEFLTPETNNNYCNQTGISYLNMTNKSIGSDVFYVCKQDKKGNPAADYIKVIIPYIEANSTLEMQFGNVWNLPPGIVSQSMIPSNGIVGDEINYNINLSDPENDYFNAKLLVSVNDTEFSVMKSANFSDDATLNLSTNQSWVGNNSYMFSYYDWDENGQLHTAKNSSVFSGPMIFARSSVNFTNMSQPVHNFERGLSKIWCGVFDSVTGEGIHNYTAGLYIYDGMDLIYNKSKTTDENGSMKFKWHSASYELKNYTVICNISDNPEMLYKAENPESVITGTLQDTTKPNITSSFTKQSHDNSPTLQVSTNEPCTCYYAMNNSELKIMNNVSLLNHTVELPRADLEYVSPGTGHYEFIQNKNFIDNDFSVNITCFDPGNNPASRIHEYKIDIPKRDQVFYEEGSRIVLNLSLEKPGLNVGADFSNIDPQYGENKFETVEDKGNGSYAVVYDIDENNSIENGQYRVSLFATDNGELTFNSSLFVHYHNSSTWSNTDVSDAFACYIGSAGYYFDEKDCNWLADVEPSLDRRAAGKKLLSSSESYGCFDSVDNDGDGMIDCDDPDCQGIYYACRQQANISSATILDDPCTNNLCNLPGSLFGGIDVNYLNLVQPGEPFRIQFVKPSISGTVVRTSLGSSESKLPEEFNVSQDNTEITTPINGKTFVKEVGCQNEGSCFSLSATSFVNDTDKLFSGDLNQIMEIELPENVEEGNYVLEIGKDVNGQIKRTYIELFNVSHQGIVNESDHLEEGVATYCSDNIDNDLNSRLDCTNDPGSWDLSCNRSNVTFNNKVFRCELGTELTCDDNGDNDRDSLTDCPEDPDCDNVEVEYQSKTGTCNFHVERNCSDGFNNDWYQLTDCELSDAVSGMYNDPDYNNAAEYDCQHYCRNKSIVPNQEIGSTCTDNIDNDMDFWLPRGIGSPRQADKNSSGGMDGRYYHPDDDCDMEQINVDGNVFTCELKKEQSCNDGFDNDRDSLVNEGGDQVVGDGADCDDYDCAGEPNCPGNEVSFNGTTYDFYHFNNTPGWDWEDNKSMLWCLDGIDNDLDKYSSEVNGTGTTGQGGVDCVYSASNWDSDCNQTAIGPAGQKCELGWETSCTDNFDNDQDNGITRSTGWGGETDVYGNSYVAGGDCDDYNCRDIADPDGDYSVNGTNYVCPVKENLGICNSSSCSQQHNWCNDGIDNDLDNYNKDGMTKNDDSSRGVDCRAPGNNYDIDCNMSFINDTDNAGYSDIGQCQLEKELNCADGFDNDLDGNYDCEAELDCRLVRVDGGQWNWSMPMQQAACPVNETYDTDGNLNVSRCSDGKDNDLDGYADCLDPDCEGYPGPGGATCSNTELINCTDGISNDGDDFIDCYDSECYGVSKYCPVSEFNVTGYDWQNTCSDNIDNDLDNANHYFRHQEQVSKDYVDCLDSDCKSKGGICAPCAAVENISASSCSDNFDNDYDSFVDCRDPDCDGMIGPDGQICEYQSEQFCNDGKDNDMDGRIDCLDNDCNCYQDELGPGQCSDNINNEMPENHVDYDCNDAECFNTTICRANMQEYPSYKFTSIDQFDMKYKDYVHRGENFSITFTNADFAGNSLFFRLGNNDYKPGAVTLTELDTGNSFIESQPEFTATRESDIFLKASYPGTIDGPVNVSLIVTVDENLNPGVYSLIAQLAYEGSPTDISKVFSFYVSEDEKPSINGIVPSDGSRIHPYKDSFEFSVNATDAGEFDSGIQECAYSFDNVSWTVIDDCKTNLTLNDGNYHVNVMTKDGAGNVNYEETSFEVVNPPEVTKDLHINRTFINKTGHVMVDVNFSSDFAGTGENCRVNLYNSTKLVKTKNVPMTSSQGNGNCRGVIELDLAEGHYYMQVNVTDNNGVTGKTTKQGFWNCEIVKHESGWACKDACEKNVPPVIGSVIQNPDSVYKGNTVMVLGSVYDTGSDFGGFIKKPEYPRIWLKKSNETAFNSVFAYSAAHNDNITYSWTLNIGSQEPVGVWQYYIQAKDTGGKEDIDARVWNFTVLPSSIVFDIIKPLNEKVLWKNENLNLTALATDESGVPITANYVSWYLKQGNLSVKVAKGANTQWNGYQSYNSSNESEIVSGKVEAGPGKLFVRASDILEFPANDSVNVTIKSYANVNITNVYDHDVINKYDSKNASIRVYDAHDNMGVENYTVNISIVKNNSLLDSAALRTNSAGSANYPIQTSLDYGGYDLVARIQDKEGSYYDVEKDMVSKRFYIKDKLHLNIGAEHKRLFKNKGSPNTTVFSVQVTDKENFTIEGAKVAAYLSINQTLVPLNQSYNSTKLSDFDSPYTCVTN